MAHTRINICIPKTILAEADKVVPKRGRSALFGRLLRKWLDEKKKEKENEV